MLPREQSKGRQPALVTWIPIIGCPISSERKLEEARLLDLKRCLIQLQGRFRLVFTAWDSSSQNRLSDMCPGLLQESAVEFSLEQMGFQTCV